MQQKKKKKEVVRVAALIGCPMKALFFSWVSCRCEMEWTGKEQNGVIRSSLLYAGLGKSGREWNSVGKNRMEWNGMEQSKSIEIFVMLMNCVT